MCACACACAYSLQVGGLELSSRGWSAVRFLNVCFTLKQTACRCPTVGAAAPAALGGRRAGAQGGH